MVIKMDWKAYATHGNRCFHNKHWVDAERHYGLALHAVEKENPVTHQNGDILFAWLACHHNLATLFQFQNKHSEARFYLDTPLEILEKTLGETPPENPFFVSLLRAYQTGLNELCLFEKAINSSVASNAASHTKENVK